GYLSGKVSFEYFARPVSEPTPSGTTPQIKFDRLISADCRTSSGRPFGTILRGLWRSTRSQSVNWQDSSVKWEGEVPEIRGGLDRSGLAASSSSEGSQQLEVA